MPPPPGTIQHLVVLMLENRSFDHLLGFLKTPGYAIDGLEGTESNPSPAGPPIVVSPDASYSGDLTADPGHTFEDVQEQIFGGGAAAAMDGFVANYAKKTAGGAADVMKCFAPGKLPIITTLARSYGVCQRWFSSVPGPTLPNRAFAHGATSLGRLDMAPEYFRHFRTIYQLLDERAVTSRIYYHDATVAMTFDYLLQRQATFFGTFQDFLDDCAHDRLPRYSFIEPRYNSQVTPAGPLQANDQHPDHNVHQGERLISRIYTALTADPGLWRRCLFVIVYDEHGGLYDHVRPPDNAKTPDGLVSNPQAFDFTRLGVRVPAIVMSPWVPEGHLEATTFDHTSLAATARRLFTADYDTNALTERDRAAATLDCCLLLDAPRDVVHLPQPLLATLGGDTQPDPRATDMSEWQADLVQHAYELERELPPGARSGKTPAMIRTEQDAAQYLEQVFGELRKRM